MNFKLRLLALLLLVMMVFTSCSIESIMQYIPGFGGDSEQTTTTTTEPTTTTTTTKRTTRPTIVVNPGDNTSSGFDVSENQTSKKELLARYTLTTEEVDALKAMLNDMVEASKTEENLDRVETLYNEFDVSFYHIAQQATIATIIYYYDMSDEESQERYLGATDALYSLQDEYKVALRTMYLESPYSDELFEGWPESDIQALLEYDSSTLELKKEIDELQVQFDQLSEQDEDFDEKSVEIYKQLVIKSNALARFFKYDNYYDYASVNVYERDYEKEQLAEFRAYVAEYIVPYFEKIVEDFNVYQNWTSKSNHSRLVEFVNDPFYSSPKRNYLIKYLDSLEGTMGESMRDVFESKNCLFSFSGNSHPTAFQTYLYEDQTPFCFFGSNGQTANTVVHEIGHYYAALQNNDLNNYDLCETHSQGNEFLFLTFCKDHFNEEVYDVIRAYQLLNACYTMIMPTIIDEFEQRIYALDDETIMAMTSEDFDAIMHEVCRTYGGASWVSEFVSDPYSYWRNVCISSPVYYISYAVSSSAAVNIFAIAEEDYDAALVAYQALVEGVTYEDGFLGALAKAGLTTPFDEETFINIKEVLEK